jgi:MSHA biogenesis protein MshL
MGGKMVTFVRVALILLGFLIVSCSSKTAVKTGSVNPHPPAGRDVPALRPPDPIPPPPPPVVAPTYREVDPFEGKTFTMSAVDAPLSKVLYAIADGAGLNLILSPEVDPNLRITATFSRVPLREALDIIMDMTGLYYQVVGNVLYVKAFMTRTFKLPYVHTVTEYTSSLGGDVLGGALAFGGGFAGAGLAGTAGAVGGLGRTGLRGNFTVDYRNVRGSTDFYAQIEENLKQLLSERGRYVLNRFTGTLIVTDYRRNVEKVEEFIKKLKAQVSKQVLIEAKIVEIALSDEFQYGIDWQVLFRDVFGTGANVTLSQNLSIPTGGYATLRVTSADLNLILNALASYGKVYTLSNPRIMVANGQTALIATGIVTPFFERQAITIVPGTTPTTQVQENIIRTNVLEGILLGVTPFIDDEGNVILNIVPVSTRLEGTRTLERDGEVLAEAPVLNIKEAGTVIKVRDGDLVVIGGLIGDVKGVEERKVPGLGDLPLIGYAFKHRREFKEKRELIIFLRPRVVSGSL